MLKLQRSARFVLPLAVPTKIYMSGSIRSWLHYIELRSANGTQKEHMDIALVLRRFSVSNFQLFLKQWRTND